MNQSSALYMGTAREMLEDAAVLISQKRYAAVVNRTYYAVFYAASAMLVRLELKFQSHYGVKTKFHELFVKSARVERRFGETLSNAYDLRQDADYSPETRSKISREVAEEEIQKAKEFVAMAERFLEGTGELH